MSWIGEALEDVREALDGCGGDLIYDVVPRKTLDDGPDDFNKNADAVLKSHRRKTKSGNFVLPGSKWYGTDSDSIVERLVEFLESSKAYKIRYMTADQARTRADKWVAAVEGASARERRAKGLPVPDYSGPQFDDDGNEIKDIIYLEAGIPVSGYLFEFVAVAITGEFVFLLCAFDDD